jgi:hypothetical protein
VSVAEFSAPAKTHGDDEDTSGTFPTVISLPFPPRRVSGDERVLSREAAIPPDKVPPKEPTGERRFDRITPVDDGILERVDVREAHPEFEIELKRLIRCAESTVSGETAGEAGWAERRRADAATYSGYYETWWIEKEERHTLRITSKSLSDWATGPEQKSGAAACSARLGTRVHIGAGRGYRF